MSSDERITTLRAAELPHLERVAFFDYASVGPLPLRHVRAAEDVLRRHAHEGPEPGQGGRLLEAARAEAACLLHAEAASVAVLRSTSEGLALVAEGLDWSDGDEVLLYERDFVGCTAPFTRLEERGVRVRWIPDRGGRFELDDVAALLGPRARAVAVSIVDRSQGFRAPVRELGELCREHGAWLVLDAAQAMGVLDLDPAAIGADVIAAHGYKFLCAGFGLALAWCSQRAIDALRPPLAGWKNAEASADAARFEPTMPSLAALAGLHASLTLLNEIDEREPRALALAARVADLLDVPATGSPIVTAPRPELVPRLAAAGIACSEVDGAVRFSTHAFTTDGDVDRLAAAV